MLEVQSTEARARWAELLQTVEQGDSIAITRQGKVIAYLTPAVQRRGDHHRAAVERFREYISSLSGPGMTVEEILEAKHADHPH